MWPQIDSTSCVTDFTRARKLSDRETGEREERLTEGTRGRQQYVASSLTILGVLNNGVVHTIVIDGL